jgi:urocanate hydratase
MNFKEQIKQGIPVVLPPAKPYPAEANRAPKRKDILSTDEKQLAVRNALRYFLKLGIKL